MGFVERPIHTVRTTASPSRPKPGGPIRLTVDVLDAEGKAIPGAFPLTVRAFDSKDRPMPQFNRAASLESGGAITVNTALDDPAGRWTFVVTESISHLQCHRRRSPRKPAGTGTMGTGKGRVAIVIEAWDTDPLPIQNADPLPLDKTAV